MTTRHPKLSIKDHNDIATKGYACLSWQEFDYKIEKRDGVYSITQHNGECRTVDDAGRICEVIQEMTFAKRQAQRRLGNFLDKLQPLLGFTTTEYDPSRKAQVIPIRGKATRNHITRDLTKR